MSDFRFEIVSVKIFRTFCGGFFFFQTLCLNWNNVPLAKEYIQVNFLPFYTGVGH